MSRWMAHHNMSVLSLTLFLFLSTPSFVSAAAKKEEAPLAVEPSCAEWSGAECSWEPNMRPMTVDFGSYKETFYAYVRPDVSTFYNETAKKRAPKKMAYKGMFGKFINHSPEQLRIYWDSGSPSRDRVYISDLAPFASAGTATHPGHVFVVTPAKDPNKILTTFLMDESNSLYYYDPFGGDLAKAAKVLNEDDQLFYHMQLENQVFAQQYRAFTGTDWLALYKQKMPPQFHMWRADSIGQTFTVETKEIHFVEYPEDETELTRGTSAYGPRPDELERMRKHRHQYPTLNLTLTALSCAPRVFEIKDFLSEPEVNHLLHLAGKKTLHKSTTQASANSETADTGTRTSTQNWIPRQTDVMVDAIYKRAADVLQMNEALLRWRKKTEIPEFEGSQTSVAERLQLVHYNVGEQYTPHHDFAMPALIAGQPSRFATILFYLNDDMEGGETSFPRWLNAETSAALTVKPEKGKAILFYNLLPDGNYDDLSQHAALPVVEGEKYLTNLWVWDPYLDHTSTVHI